MEVPAELQAAVDGGNVELVKEMLKTPPAGMSKALVKKLIKNSLKTGKTIDGVIIETTGYSYSPQGAPHGNRQGNIITPKIREIRISDQF